MDKRIYIRAVLAVWVFIWALFLVRPYFKKDLFQEYSTLLTLSLDEKKAYVTGRELYDFIKFCSESMPPPSTYKVFGLDKEPLDERRLVYYLYPNIETDSPDFLLVYKIKDFHKNGYGVFKRLDAEKYILKKLR